MTEHTTLWSPVQKITFRFIFILLFLFIFLFNNGAYPMMSLLMQFPLSLLHKFIPWFAATCMHLPYQVTVFTNGSGDTTYDYLVLLCIVIAALAGTVIWTIIDRKSKNYDRLFYWLTVGVRYYVGFMLISYGSVKVIKLQFSSPGFTRLIQPYGDSSPMGLAWTFLGFSKGYNMFMGLMEILAGLLLFRRTVTIGAIITLMASANVMAVNYFYDVPVKIVSTALVLMSLYLLAPNLSPLLAFFFGNQQVKLKLMVGPVFKRKWMFISFRIFKYLLIAFVILTATSSALRSRQIYGEAAPKSPLYGAYKVEKFVKADTTSEESKEKKWKYLMMSGVEYATIKYESDSVEWLNIKIDSIKKTLVLIPIAQAVKTRASITDTLRFKYQVLDQEHLILNGTNRDSLKVELIRQHFQLTERGFHWINEYPYNR